MCPADVLARIDALAAREERAYVRAWAIALGIGVVSALVLNGAYWLAVFG